MKKRKKNELLTLVAIMAATLLLMWCLNPVRFLRVSNIQSMAFQLPELGFLSIAMMVTMITGGINLSIVSTANLSGIVAALVMHSAQASGGQDASPLLVVCLAIAAALAASALVGLVNGFLIAVVEVPAILATLGMMTLLNGVSILLTKGYVISDFPEGFRAIGNGLLSGVPVPIIVFAAAVVLVALLLSRSAFGFELYMIGTNPTATLYAGVNNRRVLIKTYLLSGIMCGFAAIIMISRFNSAKSDYGASYLLVTVLAAVLGGVSVSGGFGRVTGLVLSLAILQLLSSGLNLLQANAFLTRAIWGIVLILVMVINNFSAIAGGRRKS